MDLLGGYGSESSSSSSCGTSSASATKPSNDSNTSTATNKPRSILKKSKLAATVAPPGCSSKSTPTTTGRTTTATTQQQQQQQQQRRKKKLLSLSAVLPPEIFNLLTSAKSGRRLGSDDDDDDDEEDSDEGQQPTKATTSKKSKRIKHTKSDDSMNGIDHASVNARRGGGGGGGGGGTFFASLLSELHSTKAAATTSTKPIGPVLISVSSTSSTNSKLHDNDDHDHDNISNKTTDKEDDGGGDIDDKLGFAFTNRKQQTISRRKRNTATTNTTIEDAYNNDVIDIHSYNSNNNISSNSVNLSKDTRRNSGARLNNFKHDEPQQESIHSLQQPKIPPPTATTTTSQPLIVRTFNDNRSRHLNKFTVRAAPSFPQHAATTTSSPQQLSILQSVNTTLPQHDIGEDLNDNTNNIYNNDNSNSSSNNNRSARQRRKEIERALRRGGTVTADDTIDMAQSLDQIIPTYHHHGDSQLQSQPTIIATSQGGRGRVPAVQMYDPKLGGVMPTTEITFKHRSKHQINQMAQSAIALEASRRATAATATVLGNSAGVGGSKSGTNARADAKRKYGW